MSEINRFYKLNQCTAGNCYNHSKYNHAHRFAHIAPDRISQSYYWNSVPMHTDTEQSSVKRYYPDYSDSRSRNKHYNSPTNTLGFSPIIRNGPLWNEDHYNLSLYASSEEARRAKYTDMIVMQDFDPRNRRAPFSYYGWGMVPQ